jgi:hypothetical protein
MAYLDGAGCEDRLAEINIFTTITDADARAASNLLEAVGPFIGDPQDEEQTLAFPRTLNPNGTENEDTDVPDDILDAVALAAYRIATDDPPPLTGRSRSGLSESYASSTPAKSQAERRFDALISPYLRHKPGRANVTSLPWTAVPQSPSWWTWRGL